MGLFAMAMAEPEADAQLLYNYNYNYPSVYHYGKREAEAEPEAEADPALIYTANTLPPTTSLWSTRPSPWLRRLSPSSSPSSTTLECRLPWSTTLLSRLPWSTTLPWSTLSTTPL